MMRKCISVGLYIAFSCFGQSVWLETTQSDFADGIFERNIYASHLGGGAVEFAPRFDLNNDGYLDLFTADRLGWLVRIYWGSATGYSSGSVTTFPTTAGSNCDAADLDGDGFADFVVSHYLQKLSIYWGGPAGPNPVNYQDFPMVAYNRHGVFIADLDKDGYLDIATSQEFTFGCCAVLWGSAFGYSLSNRTDLPCGFGNHNMEVADFDADGWLDLLSVVYNGYDPGVILIYWGSSTGFNPGNSTWLAGPDGNCGMSVADLNGDGHLDLVATGWYDQRSYVYWGSASGYGTCQVLNPGYCYGGSAVADINEDGYLDIVYHRGGYGIAQQRVYWGSPYGYSDFNSSGIGLPLETTGGLVADLNGDGHLDIFTSTRTPGTESYIFFGPTFQSTVWLPVVEDHHAMFREIGNVYKREYYEDYVSSVFDADSAADWGTVEWLATTPSGTSVLFWARSGDTPVPDSLWSGWLPVSNGDSLPDTLSARYLQYRSRLGYADPCYLPDLREVSVTHTPIGIVTGSALIASGHVGCWPNPFKTRTTISVVRPESEAIRIKIYDIKGDLIRTFDAPQYRHGCYYVEWDRTDNIGRRVSAGTYFYRVDGAGPVLTEKIIVID